MRPQSHRGQLVAVDHQYYEFGGCFGFLIRRVEILTIGCRFIDSLQVLLAVEDHTRRRGIDQPGHPHLFAGIDYIERPHDISPKIVFKLAPWFGLGRGMKYNVTISHRRTNVSFIC